AALAALRVVEPRLALAGQVAAAVRARDRVARALARAGGDGAELARRARPVAPRAAAVGIAALLVRAVGRAHGPGLPARRLARAVVAILARAPAGDRVPTAGHAPELAAILLALAHRVTAAVGAGLGRAGAEAVHIRADRGRLLRAHLIPGARAAE